MAVVEVEALGAGAPAELLVSQLTAVVNAAYAIGEHGLWRAGVSRIEREVLAGIAAGGELVIARSGGVALGCVRVRELAGEAVEIGMLAADPGSQGLGVGSALMDFAEDRARCAGRTSVQLDLLVPVAGVHPAKERLARWYARRDYALVARTSVQEHYPELVVDLRVDCEMLTWRKAL